MEQWDILFCELKAAAKEEEEEEEEEEALITIPSSLRINP